MSRIRLLPLLLAVATLPLTAAGCGGSDDASTTAAASIPAATQPATTPTTSAPATTTDTATAPPTTTDTAPAPTTAPTTGTTSTPAKAAGDGSPLQALKDYTKGGSPASAADAAAVRAAFRTFIVAIGKQDAKTACAHVIGMEQLLRAAHQQGMSCEKMFQQMGKGATPPTQQDLDQIAKAQVTIKGDRATLSAAGQTPMPMRKEGGVWKMDYGAFGDLSATHDGK